MASPVIDTHAHIVPPDMLAAGDYPFEMGEVDPVATVTAVVPSEQQDAVPGGTVQRILCIDRACGCGGRRLRPAAGAVP